MFLSNIFNFISFFRCIFLAKYIKQNPRITAISKFCQDKNFTEETLISTTDGMIEHIAVDWIGKNVLWTDSKQDVIGITNFDGTKNSTIEMVDRLNNSHVFDRPRAIELDPIRGRLI